jgi:hypothetical protein
MAVWTNNCSCHVNREPKPLFFSSEKEAIERWEACREYGVQFFAIHTKQGHLLNVHGDFCTGQASGNPCIICDASIK